MAAAVGMTKISEKNLLHSPLLGMAGCQKTVKYEL
jgi:hypothetical protein